MSVFGTPYRHDGRIEVPHPDTPWFGILEFALSYNGYMRHGTFEAVADIADGVRQQWRDTGHFDADLDSLRCALFFEQRAYHHSDSNPNAEYIQALLIAIRDASGGTVPGPPDPLP